LRIDISGRHLLVTNAMKEYAREKTERLSRHYDRIRRIQIVMDVQGERHQVELVVSLLKGSQIIAHAQDSSMYAALDFVVDKCERQLTKLKEKLRDHKGHMPMAGPETAEERAETDGDLEIDVDLLPEVSDSVPPAPPAAARTPARRPTRRRTPAPRSAKTSRERNRKKGK
jgi:ribosome hibernation promoting factor